MNNSDDNLLSGAHDKETLVEGHTCFVDVKGKLIAFRIVGSGEPLLLCNRYWGYLDSWDPMFINSLASMFTVITFDYSGLGLSTGRISYDHKALAHDIRDLALALNFDKIIIGGWSTGGLPAQAFAMTFPEMVSHVVLIGTAPTGKNSFPVEQQFYNARRRRTALREQLAEFAATESAEKSHADMERLGHYTRLAADFADTEPEQVCESLFEANQDNESYADCCAVREQLKLTTTPILVISGDHDLVFPVENWYSLLKELPTTHLIVLPQTGHRPHCQFPDTVAQYIATFVQHVPVEAMNQA
jgi:pimeloyl-ACP methyl ester carboxylesterase